MCITYYMPDKDMQHNYNVLSCISSNTVYTILFYYCTTSTIDICCFRTVTWFDTWFDALRKLWS